MIQKSVHEMMIEFHMVSSGEKLLAAVSGGADSVCLLLVLKELQKTLDFSLEAIHVEHGIRGEESLRDEHFVKELCDSLCVPLTCEHVDVLTYSKERGIGEEEAARVLRYERFTAVAKEKNAKVVLAHHMEDNAETMLFHMIRGSGLSGMCGMKPVRVDESGVTYLRPLLRVHRAEIEEKLMECGQQFCVDSTNLELDYSRNYLRKEILPRLLTQNAQAVNHISALAERLWSVQEYLMQEVDKVWQDKVKVCETESSVSISVDALGELHIELQKTLLKRMLEHVAESSKDITSGHIEDLLNLSKKQSGRSINLPYGVIAKRVFGELVLEKKCLSDREELRVSGCLSDVRNVSPEELYHTLETGEVLSVGFEGGQGELTIRVFPYTPETDEIPKKAYTKWLDYDKIKQGFCIRTRRNGDYFVSDAAGHHKKLQNYFVDEKIPLQERDKKWILAKDSQVLWMIGGRISEDVKVTEDTQLIVELRYIGG